MNSNKGIFSMADALVTSKKFESNSASVTMERRFFESAQLRGVEGTPVPKPE